MYQDGISLAWGTSLKIHSTPCDSGRIGEIETPFDRILKGAGTLALFHEKSISMTAIPMIPNPEMAADLPRAVW